MTYKLGGFANMQASQAPSVNGRKRRHKAIHIRIPAASKKAMLVRLAHELWKADRLDLDGFLEARCRPIKDEYQALRVILRSSIMDLEPAVLSCLNGDVVEVEGHAEVLGNAERELLSRLGVELPSTAPLEDEPEPMRFIDMTPALLGFAAVVMALRYLALGLSDRELYVMAGIGYAAFILIRTFSYKLKRPKNAPPIAVSHQRAVSRQSSEKLIAELSAER